MKVKNSIIHILIAFLWFSKIIFAGNVDTTKNPLFSQYKEISQQFYQKGKYDSAIIFIKKGIELSIREKNTGKETDFLGYLSSCMRQKGYNDSALIIAFKAFTIDKIGGDEKKIASDLYRIGKYYGALSDLTKGYDYTLKAFNLYEKNKDMLGQLNCLGEMAYVYATLKKHEVSIEYNLKAINLAQEAKEMYLPQIRGYANIAASYSELKQFNKALEYNNKALALSRKAGQTDTSVIYINMGVTYNALHQPIHAIDYFKQALESIRQCKKFETNINESQATASYGLGHSYYLMNYFSKAESHLLYALQIARKHNFVMLMGEINKELSDVYSKQGKFEKAIEYFKYYHDISDTLLSASNIEALTKNEMQYKFDKQDQQRLADQQKKDLENKADMEKKSKIIYLLSAVAIFFTGISLIIYLIYRQAKLQNQHRELMTENRLMRAQMSPHFIFNSLNSIQKLVLEDKNESVLSYLHDFSSVLRIMLDNSFHALVPLENEISFIKHYVSLEKLRFNNDFRFNINVHKDINEYTIKIPPMLIQPAIENAIKHGIAYKAAGIIAIDFWIEEKTNCLHCMVEDTGIGRKKSKELKMNTSPKHESRGMELIHDRISLHNFKRKKDFYAIHITDLYDCNNQATGTKVEYVFPINLN